MNYVMLVITLALSVVSTSAQSDSIITRPVHTRESNLEWYAGITNASYVYTDQRDIDGFTSPEDSRLLIHLGVGAHVPLIALGRYTTLWLVPATHLDIGVRSIMTINGVEQPRGGSMVDLCLPIHVTLGYGGIRRSPAEWGVEGGLGVNIVRRFTFDEFTVTPSAMVDISYVPRGAYRLRFTTDLMSAGSKSTQAYSVSFVCSFRL